MRVRILGECVLELSEREYTPASPYFFALLLRLSADPGRFFQRQELADLLFPHAPHGRAATHSLRQLIYLAHQRGALLEKANSSVALSPASLSIDLEESLLQDHSLVGARHRALTVLPGYSPAISEAFDEWLDIYRTLQQSRVRHSLVAAIELLRRRADWPAVEARSLECLSLDPFSEPATLALAEALARTGSKERAVVLLEAYKTEVGAHDLQIALPATLLRKRIESNLGNNQHNDARVPLVGRGDAMSSINDQWRTAREGQVQCTLIRGEPGSGKSRLIEEFFETVTLSGLSSVVLVRKSASERFRPFGFFADLVPSLLRLPGAAGCDPRLLPFLTRLTVGMLREEGEMSVPGEAQFISLGINRAIVDLIDSIGSEKSCVILIDDSRAIDDVSLALLGDLHDIALTLPIHFVIACDDSDLRDGIARFPARTIHLKPLSQEASTRLLRLLHNGTSRVLSEEDINWCTTVAAGNPTFLRLVLAQCSSSSLRLDIPKNLLAAVDRRLASLSSDASRILEACAVLGDHCDAMLLADVIGLTPFSIIGALHELEHTGLIESHGGRLLLRSALFRDRIVLSASTSVLTLLHARSALIMAKHVVTANSSWRIASHWHSAGQHHRARATLTASWRRSLELGQPKHAEDSIREYLSLATDASERIALYEDLIEVTQAAGNTQATVLAIDERADLVRATNGLDTRSAALSFDRLDAQLQDHADPSQPERELIAFMKSGHLDNARRLRATQRLLASADATANPSLAEAVYGVLHTLPVTDASAKAYYNQSLLIYHSVFGQKTDALSIARELIATARREPHCWPHIRGQVNAALALQLTGDSDEAIGHLEDCYSQLLATAAIPTCVLVASRLASFCLDAGNIDSASRWVRLAESHVNSGITGRLPSEYLSAQTDLAIIAGDFSSARQTVATMRDASPLYKAPRFRMELLSYGMRLAQYEGRTTSDSDVNELLEWHLRARCYGRHDENMDALWVALVQQHKQLLAGELLSDYLRIHRRETRPCGYFLRIRTASDPAWLQERQHPYLDSGVH